MRGLGLRYTQAQTRLQPRKGPSPPWQSGVHRGCAPSPHPAAQTSADAAAGPGTGLPALLQQSWPHPPATPSLQGTGGGRALALASPALFQLLCPLSTQVGPHLLPPTFHGLQPWAQGTGRVVQSPRPHLPVPGPAWPPCLLFLCIPSTVPSKQLSLALPCFNPLSGVLVFSGECPNPSALGDLPWPTLTDPGLVWLLPASLSVPYPCRAMPVP